jgi:membrane-bound lytic murein transglycosylase D
VPVRQATDLRVIAECVGSGLDSVQYLNPELRRLATPANRTYDLRVPRGRASDLKGCLDRLPAEKRVTFRTHTLARGQTLSSVARLYGAKVAEIAQANGIATGKRLARGTELIIPVRQASAAPAVRPVRHVQTEEPDGRTRVRHRIQPGDTLTSIAARYNATVQELMSWNNLTGSRLAAGNTLTVYTRP